MRSSGDGDGLHLSGEVEGQARATCTYLLHSQLGPEVLPNHRRRWIGQLGYLCGPCCSHWPSSPLRPCEVFKGSEGAQSSTVAPLLRREYVEMEGIFNGNFGGGGSNDMCAASLVPSAVSGCEMFKNSAPQFL